MRRSYDGIVFEEAWIHGRTGRNAHVSLAGRVDASCYIHSPSVALKLRYGHCCLCSNGQVANLFYLKETIMRTAFVNAVARGSKQVALAIRISDGLIRNKARNASGWNASLSYRTFKKLESEGYEKFSG